MASRMRFFGEEAKEEKRMSPVHSSARLAFEASIQEEKHRLEGEIKQLDDRIQAVNVEFGTVMARLAELKRVLLAYKEFPDKGVPGMILSYAIKGDYRDDRLEELERSRERLQNEINVLERRRYVEPEEKVESEIKREGEFRLRR